MGLFLGMSFISCAELIIYLIKITWIMISKKRRQYMVLKKEKELVRFSTREIEFYKILPAVNEI